MKKIFILVLFGLSVLTQSLAQQPIYEVTMGNGNGIRFWQNDLWKMHMGNWAEYQYGPVTDYSIKVNMDGTAGRGWTWGIAGQTPVAALNNQGYMQIAGSFTAGGNINIAGASGRRLFMGGVAGSTFGIAYDTNNPNYGIFYTEGSPDYVSISPNGNGTSGVMNILGNGNVGIGTTQPNSALAIKGRLGIRADAAPTAPGETLRVEGAFTSEENVANITNLFDQDFIVRLSGAGSSTKRTIIGPSVSNRFSLGVGVNNGNEFLTIINGGNVGIGTTSPAYKLEVSGGAIALDADQPLRGGGKWLISGNSSMVTVGTANPGVGLRFYAGADINRMIIDPATGNVGIGSQTPTQKLTVNGTIYGKEVKVDLSVPGPDYVFDEDYKLIPLEEIKTYIDKNKHLPEVPSAKEMERDGIQLGEMNMLLLKKIEELTLYMIELKKEDVISREQMRTMQLRIDQLTKIK